MTLLQSHVTPTLLPQAASGQSESRAVPVDWWLPGVAVVTILLCLPFLRVFHALDDEGVLLLGADRMLQGQALYRDFFEFLPPGGFVITALWFSVTGISVLAARSLVILVIAGIACFTYLSCRRVSRNAPLAAALTLGWVVMSQGLWTQLNHHWLTCLFSVAGGWAALVGCASPRDRLRWPLIAGLAIGTAAMITPTCGALAMLAGLVGVCGWQPPERRAMAVYVAAGLVVPLALIGALAWRHTLVPAFEDVILFTALQYAPIQALPFGTRANVQNYPLALLFPLAGVLALLVWIRNWRGGVQDRLLLLSGALGLAGFIGSFPRADVAHIAFNVPLVLPLLAHCATRLFAEWSMRAGRLLAGAAIMVCLPSVLAFAWVIGQAGHGELVATQRGDARLLGPDGARDMMRRVAALPPQDKYFFYPFMPTMPFLVARPHVARYDVFTPEYSTPLQYQDACQSVMQGAAWVIVDRRWMDADYLKRVFPTMKNPRPHETVAFEAALDRAFVPVVQAGVFQLRQRRTDVVVSDSMCADILQ